MEGHVGFSHSCLSWRDCEQGGSPGKSPCFCLSSLSGDPASCGFLVTSGQGAAECQEKWPQGKGRLATCSVSRPRTRRAGGGQAAPPASSLRARLPAAWVPLTAAVRCRRITCVWRCALAALVVVSVTGRGRQKPRTLRLALCLCRSVRTGMRKGLAVLEHLLPLQETRFPATVTLNPGSRLSSVPVNWPVLGVF